MPDKQLLRLLGEDKRYIYRAVAWMLTGSLSSIGFTACLCYGLHLLLIDARTSFYPLPFILGAVCGAARFLATIRAASVRDRLGRSVKKSLRAQLYAKLLRLGVRETKTVKRQDLPSWPRKASSSWFCTIPPICRSFSVPCSLWEPDVALLPGVLFQEET